MGLFALLGLLAVVGVGFVVAWVGAVRKARSILVPDDAAAEEGLPTGNHLAIGFITNFFDTLGIGSFAPTTAWFKLRRVVPDRIIPGTLNVGHTPPVIVQAFIYTVIIEVDMVTLAVLISAAVLGAWFGAGIVASWPRRKIQLGMGIALLVAAGLMVMAYFELGPQGGDGLSLPLGLLMIAALGNVMLGALMTLGIGMYAPCMIMIALMGMDPRAAFPIMMGSCAFLMPVGSVRFVRKNAYALRPALGLAIGGIPAVLIAAYIVRELPLAAIRWLVVIVVTYTAIAMLRSARQRDISDTELAPQPQPAPATVTTAAPTVEAAPGASEPTAQ
jgi:uncharacterized membrane protein YfcA